MPVAASNRPWSLRQRLARVLVLTALLPALLFGVALLRSQWVSEHDSLMLRLDANARLIADATDDFLEAQLSGLELVARRSAGDANHAVDLQGLLDAYPALQRALHADADGRIVDFRSRNHQETPPSAPLVGDRSWFARARDTGKPQVSTAFRPDFYGHDLLVAFSAPLRIDGRFAGVLQASIPAARLVEARSENLRRHGFELLVLDRSDQVVHASPALRWRTLEVPGEVATTLRRIARPSARPGEILVMDGLLRGDGRAYVKAVSMRNDWLMVLVSPHQHLLTPFIPRMGMLAALLIITSLGVLWALWHQRRLLRDSIGNLLGSLRGYALGGKLDDTRADVMPEELQPLAAGIGDLSARMNAAFDKLQNVLDEREQVIEERTESLRRAVADLDRLSRTDALTGALNYRGFREAAETLFKQARAGDSALSVLALDIDHFKAYNDRYGHPAGDAALRRFAGAVRSALQHADDVLARPGGEEFTVFLPGTTLAQARAIAHRVAARVRDAEILHEGSPAGRVTVSVGVAALEPGDADVEDMLARADASMYRAKQAGRDRVGD